MVGVSPDNFLGEGVASAAADGHVVGSHVDDDADVEEIGCCRCSPPDAAGPARPARADGAAPKLLLASVGGRVVPDVSGRSCLWASREGSSSHLMN
jgi:hypothetical protein